MRNKRTWFLALFILLNGGPVPAQDLPPGKSLLPQEVLSSFTLSGGANAEREIIAVTGQPFTQALRMRTLQKPEKVYNIQLRTRIIAPVEKGDVMLCAFYIRAIEPSYEGEAFTEAVFEKAGTPYTKSLQYLASADTAWTRYDLPFKAAEDYAVDGAQLNFRLGYDPQVLDIGGITLTHYGKTVTLADLPATAKTYPWLEPDAAWRAAAETRIEQIRKADLTVVVVDSTDIPLPGAKINVQMRKHAFGFGSAVGSLYLTRDGDIQNKAIYRAKVVQLFNRVVLENALKWPQWERHGSEGPLQTIEWLAQNGIEVRGHNLIWPGWRHLPESLEDLKTNPAALRIQVNAHVKTEAEALMGKLVDWDVINEPYTNRDLMDILGQSSMIEWFNIAHQADPDVQLYINDFAILSRAGLHTDHQDHYEQTIQYLIDQGAPLHGIGMQGHFAWDLTPPERILNILDRFAAFGKPIQITEFDINITDEQLQAAYTRDFMTAVFSHPATNGILMWGFWDGRHWKENAPLFRRDWTLKPSGIVWQDLVFNKWWTRVEGTTDSLGTFATRGFQGEYEAVIAYPGIEETVRFSLPQQGHTLRVILKTASNADASRSDFDQNGQIDFADFILFAQHYGRQSADSGYNPQFDLDADGTIGFSDFTRFAFFFGHSATT